MDNLRKIANTTLPTIKSPESVTGDRKAWISVALKSVRLCGADSNAFIWIPSARRIVKRAHDLLWNSNIRLGVLLENNNIYVCIKYKIFIPVNNNRRNVSF